MSKFWALIEVLYHGKLLANSASWKKAQVAFNLVVPVIGGLLALAPKNLGITDEGVSQIATTVTMLGTAIVNAYLIPATTDKIGFRKK